MPPDGPRPAHKALSFDAIDLAIIVAMVSLFTLVATAVGAAPLMAGGRFGPIWAMVSLVGLVLGGRRMLGRGPRRGALKTGVFWSLASIAGLLTIAIGLVSAALSVFAVTKVAEREPDFVALHAADALDGSYSDVVVVDARSTRDATQRRLDERRADALARQRAESAAHAQERWVASHDVAKRGALVSAAIALVFLAIGAAIERARYDRVEA